MSPTNTLRFNWQIAVLCAALTMACTVEPDSEDASGADARVTDAQQSDDGVRDGDIRDARRDMTGDAGSDEAVVCALTEPIRSGDTDAIRCLEGWPQAPFVRLPADTPDVMFVSFDGVRFITRDGAPSAEVPPGVIAREFAHGDPIAGDRYGYAIYRLSLVDGVFADLTPAIIVDDRVFLERLKGRHFQGTISRKLGADEYDFAPTLPIALTMGDQIDLSDTPDGLHGYPIHTMDATITNTTGGVRRPDGSCLPALQDAGASNPFDALDNSIVRFSRVPNMHGNFDDVLVVEWPVEIGGSNMGSGGYLIPVMLAGSSALDNIAYGSDPHGAPGATPSMHVAEVESSVPCN